jgi:hypothetical protein
VRAEDVNKALTPCGLMLGSRGPYSLNKPLLISYFAAWALYFLRLVPLGVAIIPFGFVFALCTYLVFQRRRGRVGLLAMDALFSAVCIVVWRMVGVGSYIPVRATGLAVVALGIAAWLLAAPILRRLGSKMGHV